MAIDTEHDPFIYRGFEVLWEAHQWRAYPMLPPLSQPVRGPWFWSGSVEGVKSTVDEYWHRIEAELPPRDEHRSCPGCGLVMSARETSEQGFCNECLSGAVL